jgi:TolB protein
VWSPDGSKIAFVVEYQAGPYNRDIFVVNADGSGQTQLTTDSNGDSDPAWSPDGSKIAFTSSRTGRLQIFVMNADGTSQTRLVTTAEDAYRPAWSPDGQKVAFTVNSGGYYGLPDVYTANANGSGLSLLVAGGEEPLWAPDGARVAYTDISLCSYYRCSWNVAVVNADGSGVRRLTDGLYQRTSGWSRDGQWIAFIESACNQNGCVEAVDLLRKDGTGLGRLAMGYSPSWKP